MSQSASLPVAATSTAKPRHLRGLESLFGGSKQPHDGLHDFLPGALSIQERPPNPIAQWLARSLVLLLVLALAWAYFGHVNVVVTAEGKIVPSDRVKQIQPLTKGVVSKIWVREGDQVQAGQPLVELDTTLTHAESERFRAELYANQANLLVNEYLLVYLASETQIEPQNSNTLTPTYLRLLDEKWQSYTSQRDVLAREYGAAVAETEVSFELIKKLEQTLPIATKRADNFETLRGQQFVSENDYWLVEQERIQQAQDLAAERKRHQQLQANLQALESRQLNYVAQFKSQLLSEIADLQQTIAVLTQELAKAESLNQKQILYSPVSGQVQELAINTVGGIVTDAQQLMLIVPNEQILEAEVYLANKDIGFVHEQMTAEIKVHTFPFTKYGVVDAEITSVSDDATLDENQGLIYRAQLRLAANEIETQTKHLKLMPGMAVTAEVKTGDRRIIEFFLAPLLQHGQEALRER